MSVPQHLDSVKVTDNERLLQEIGVLCCENECYNEVINDLHFKHDFPTWVDSLITLYMKRLVQEYVVNASAG